ncbi:ABC transporter ATP-binding protein [Nocardia sp. IBHARD005]|uniref:ABC transporter ATP-binding protein n=1 Tax=Nocardia sp. IBHARD005 TaxID=3457765 RepID=UPI004058A9ED
MSIVTVENLSLRFGGTHALTGVGFEVTEGELFAVIGPNGAGKTSIFNCLSGVYRPQEGSITLAGTPLRGLRPDAIARRGVARMFQNIELFDNLTVLDNIKLGRHIHLRYSTVEAALFLGRARRAELAARRFAEGLIEFLELESVRHHPVGMLPYGIKKRVELARALAMEPSLLLLDEPVAGMNVEETEDMARFLCDIRSEMGISMIMVEHDMRLVMDLADRIMVLDFGKRIALGTPEQVRRDPAVIAAYLGGADTDSAAEAEALLESR